MTAFVVGTDSYQDSTSMLCFVFLLLTPKCHGWPELNEHHNP